MRRVAMPDDGIETLFGSFDENLRSLESALGVTLRTSGHDIVVEGDAEGVARAERTRGPRRRPHPIGLGRTYLQSILRDREEARGREQPPVARYARYLL